LKSITSLQKTFLLRTAHLFTQKNTYWRVEQTIICYVLNSDMLFVINAFLFQDKQG